MSTPGLAALLGRFPTRRFLSEHWPDTLLVQHGDPRRLEGLIDAPEFESIDALTALEAREWLAQSSRFPNGFGNVGVSGEAAAALFHVGFTIYGVEPALHSRRALAWVTALERDLGLTPGLIRTSIFLSKPGPGARMHFDAQESFVVQLKGRKRWTLAHNRDVRYATENYIAGDPVPPSLDAQLETPGRPLDTTMPPGAVTVELAPGSIMYVPRGAWHATETLEESWHLDLMLPMPTWGDHVQALLGQHFLSKAAWRAPALDGARLAERLRALITELEAGAIGSTARAKRAPRRGRR